MIAKAIKMKYAKNLEKACYSLEKMTKDELKTYLQELQCSKMCLEILINAIILELK